MSSIATAGYSPEAIGQAGTGEATQSGNMLKQGLAIAGIAVVGLLGAKEVAGPAEAEASASSPAEITSVTTGEPTILVGKSKSSASGFAKATIMANHRTVSRVQVREDMAEGNCDYFTGKEAEKAGLQTQGHNASGTGYGQEDRNSHFCDSDGDGDYDYRAECGNAARQRKPKPNVDTIWVNNFNKAKVVARSKSVAVAKTACELKTENGSVYASAYARGVGYGRGVAKIKSLYGAKGKNIEEIIAESAAAATAKASSKAKAKAVVVCAEQGGVPVPPAQHKDSTTGQQPGENAPGPNPPADPNEPYPGGYQCYDEVDAHPVAPVNGTCPVGTVGA